MAGTGIGTINDQTREQAKLALMDSIKGQLEAAGIKDTGSYLEAVEKAFNSNDPEVFKRYYEVYAPDEVRQVLTQIQEDLEDITNVDTAEGGKKEEKQEGEEPEDKKEGGRGRELEQESQEEKSRRNPSGQERQPTTAQRKQAQADEGLLERAKESNQQAANTPVENAPPPADQVDPEIQQKQQQLEAVQQEAARVRNLQGEDLKQEFPDVLKNKPKSSKTTSRLARPAPAVQARQQQKARSIIQTKERSNLQSQAQSLQRDIDYITERKKLEALDRTLEAAPEAIGQVKSGEFLKKKLAEQGLKRNQITDQQARQIEQGEMTRITETARQANRIRTQLQTMEPQINEDVRRPTQQNLTSRTLEKILTQQPRTTSLSKQEITRIIKTDNPLEALGFNKNGEPTPAAVQSAYEKRMSSLIQSNEPGAAEAIRGIQRKYSDYINASEVAGFNVREMAQELEKDMLTNRVNIAQARARMAASTTINTQGFNFTFSEWKEERKKEYLSKKKKAIEGLAYGVAGIFVPDARTSVQGKSKKRIAFDIAKAAGKAAYRISPVRGTIGFVAHSRAAGWVKTKGQGAKNFMVKLDRNTAAFLLKKTNRNVTFKKYTPNKGGWKVGFRNQDNYEELDRTSTKRLYKKKRDLKVKTFGAAQAIYKSTIGRFFNQINNVRRLVQDTIYTKTGLKALNNGRKALVTKVSTKFWGGTGGKVVINAQRAANGIRAIGRALPAGIRSGAITAGVVALATGGTAPLALMAGSALFGGGAGMISNIATNTLNSTKPFLGNSNNIIGRFQSKYGIQGRYGLTGGLTGPAEIRQDIYSKTQSAFRSFNSTMYGMGAGAVAGFLLGGPVGAAVGATAGLAAGGLTRYGLDLAANEMMKRQWVQTLSKMPFFEAVGLYESIPWIDSQVKNLLSGNIENIAKNYLDIRNPFRVFGNFTKLGFTVHNFKTLAAWTKLAGGLNTPMLIGGVVGTGIGIGIASIAGLPIATGAIIGGTIGSLLGAGIGGLFGPIGVIIGSVAGSSIGSIVGSIIDWITGKINNYDKLLESLFGALSLLKGILDFIESLGKKFDASTVVGFAMTLMFGAAILIDIGENYSNANLKAVEQTDENTAQDLESEDINAILQADDGADTEEVLNTLIAKYSTETQAEAMAQDNTDTTLAQDKNDEETNQGDVLGADTTIFDCNNSDDRQFTNPKTSIVIKLKEHDGVYTIETSKVSFRNLKSVNSGIELGGTLMKGKIVGYCR